MIKVNNVVDDNYNENFNDDNDNHDNINQVEYVN